MKDIFFLLSKDDKKLLFFIIFFILCVSVVEISIFSLIQPIVNSFSELNANFNFAIFDMEKLIDNRESLLFLFVGLFIARACFSLLIVYLKESLKKKVNDSLSEKIYKKYLDNDYEHFLNHKSSQTASNLIVEVNKFAYNLLDAFVILFVDSVLVVAIISFLLISYFEETLFTSTSILIFFSLFYFFFKKKLSSLGKLRSVYDALKIENLNKSFAVIQNIKIDSLENFFCEEFKSSTELSSTAYKKAGFLMELPRNLIEITMVAVAFFLVTLSSSLLNSNNVEILLLISLFVAAMFRMLPSMNRVFLALNNIKVYAFCSKILKNEIISGNKNIAYPQLEIKKFEKSLKFKDISFAYKKGKNIFNNLNIELAFGDIVGIKGENGSGKSTFLNLLCGLLKPQRGSFVVDDEEFLDLTSLRGKVGYVPQHTHLLNDTVLNNIVLSKNSLNFKEGHLNKILQFCCLDEVINNLEHKSLTIIGDKGGMLSGGQQQRIGIARALIKNPKILILDEATTALDKEVEKSILQNITSINKDLIIVIVSHDEKIFNICNKTYLLKDFNLQQVLD